MSNIKGLRLAVNTPAKTHLSALVDAAERGEEIVIAKNGIAKARLTPIGPRKRLRNPPMPSHPARQASFERPAPPPPRLARSPPPQSGEG